MRKYSLLFGLILLLSLLTLQNCSLDMQKESAAQPENQEQQDSIAAVAKQHYLLQGKQLALATKAVLEQNVMKAIQSKGTVGALEFCNVKAIPLSDSISTHMNAQIRRVSAKNRNPENAPNEAEAAYLKKAMQEIQNMGKAKPQMQEIDGKIVGYYPIMTNAACLQCHGTPKIDIQENTLAALQKLYPEDKATGYKADELRGMWVISMDKK